MAYLDNILRKIKKVTEAEKPADALINFLTPKEQKIKKFEDGETLTPEQRARTMETAERPVRKKQYAPELGYTPYKSQAKETAAQFFGIGKRRSTIVESLAEFGKSTLRAGPRAGASLTLESQKQRRMTPETKTEKFLFGEEPIESITERMERFPERAKEFGIPESAGKMMALPAVIGLTAMDIIPPLSGKGGLKTVAKKALTKKTVKEFIKTLTKKETKQILKAGFKSADDFFKAARNQKSAMTGLKTAAKKKPGIFQGFKDLTTKTLEKLKGRSTVSKQFISDLTNSPDLKQAERGLIREALEESPDNVPVKEFAERVKTKLLPLKAKPESTLGFQNFKSDKYESITLPDKLRGNVAKYTERIYESPIKNSAGNIHFNGDEFPNYFAHVRVEDLANQKSYTYSEAIKKLPKEIREKMILKNKKFYEQGSTRRIIEIQSDLFQKGRFPGEVDSSGFKKGVPLLEPYRNKWHERVIREEIKKAAKDGKTKLQFPAGETAMTIEGLGGREATIWYQKPFTGQIPIPSALKTENLKVGRTVYQRGVSDGWVITNILEDGKFKAVPKEKLYSMMSYFPESQWDEITKKQMIEEAINQGVTEQFDISGKIDTSNPIYKFYEKDVQKFLKRIAPDTKRITDPQGVEWFELNVNKTLAGKPVEAFGAAAGIERNEKGDITFNPKKAALGVAALAVLKKTRGRIKPTDALKKITGKAKGGKVQEIINEYQKRISMKPAKKPDTSITDSFAKAYTAIIDRFNPITKIAKKGGKLKPGENPEFLARRYLGIQGIAESKLFWKTSRLNVKGNLEVTGEGLSKILKPVKNNMDDLRTFMVAQRDIELAKRVLPGGKKVVGTTSKKSAEVIGALQKKYGVRKFKQIERTAREIREWSRRTLLDPLLEIGALSKKQHDDITKSNEFYVPFQRVMEELETNGFIPKKANIFIPKSIPVKKLKGSTREIIDPFESMITNTYKVTDFVERTRVAKSIVNLRKTSPELAGMIKPISPKIIPAAKQGEKLIFRPSLFTPEKNTIMVFENGKRKFYQVPEDVFQAVSGMMEADVGAVIKLLSFPARTLRAGATLTPEFMFRNPIRDQFTAFVFSKYGYIPGVDLIKGIWNTVGKTDTYGKWLAGGGAQSMLVSLDRISSRATLAKVLGNKDIKGVVKNPIEALRILSEFSEKGTRVGAFKRAVGKGVSDIEAAFESRDITLDFARRGSQTRAVNMLVAFWNAQIQGLEKTVRTFRERPMKTTFKAVSGITLPSVLLYLHNRNDPRYQELPQWQKDFFWIVPVGDDGPIIRIPKPFEVGIIFGTVPEHILTWIDKNDPESLASIGKVLIEASAPGYMPTAMQPIIENIADYSFFRQRSVVSPSVRTLPRELQANRYTSETAKEVGKLIKQSPAKIENLVYGYAGGLGRYAVEASDKLLKAFGVVSPPPRPAKTAADRPLLRAFVAREPIGSASESVNKFYNIYDEAKEVKAIVTELAEKGQERGAVSYLRNRPVGFYFKGLSKVARTFSELRQKRNAVLDSRDLTPEQKKRAIDALDKIMTEIAKQTLDLIKSSKDSSR